jgi:hypothetical protein
MACGPFGVLGTTVGVPLYLSSWNSRHQHVKGALAELDRPAVGKQLTAFRQHSETTERKPQWWVGSGIHWMRL